ncbi:MAG: hypothetical protein HY721_12885 [Planctomycetes bacterium]|nr:hypothetical protein [Planctomycetota bacterium]
MTPRSSRAFPSPASPFAFLSALPIGLIGLSPAASQGPAWVARYDGPASADDAPVSLALDGDGSLYVAGSSGGTGTDSDLVTIKYSSTGVLLWERRHDGPANEADRAVALRLGAPSRLYVTGVVTGVSSTDLVTFCYSRAGDLLWEQSYDGPGGGWDEPAALAIDGDGSVLVAGLSYHPATLHDIVILKYSSDGTPLWERRYDGPRGGNDIARALAIDGSGNVLVTGYSSADGVTHDFVTLKYSPSGDLLWEARYDGPGGSEDWPAALAADAADNVYVTGFSRGAGTSGDYATLKYSPAGDLLWEARYDGPGNDWDEAAALAVDGLDGVYVTGSSAGRGTSGDLTTLKYSTAGELLWQARYDGSGNDLDEASFLALDGLGNIHAAGSSTGAGSNLDVIVLEYSPEGAVLREMRYDGPGNDLDGASGLAADASGNVFVAAASGGEGNSSDIAILKISAGAILFRRGDANSSGGFDLSDAVFVLGCLFLGKECPSCTDAADSNDDGSLDLSDAVHILVWLFLGGPAPPSPGPSDCGADPTADLIDCAAFAPCS